MTVKSFTFNVFSENSYVIFDDTKECIIVDPGCNNVSEQNELTAFISDNSLLPKHLINTHCHIDHILGNQFVANKYDLKLTAHKGEKQVLLFGAQTALMYQIHYEPSPAIEIYLDEGDLLTFGKTSLEVLFTPGHSPASISLLQKDQHILICGDVLFQGSIGRTDLPGGNFETLTRVIKSKFFTLHDDTVVYSGHGETTTIGIEKRTNPFF
ncbi:MAG: MBL fold metallo-hydrolase [Saprospiraceae bacterium]|nr:MBL fold metallo-hydrolase [Saprospiraceae bacterium]